MSLIQTVVAIIEEDGPASVDELVPQIQGKTRKQIMAALHNARHLGLLQVVTRPPRSGKPGSGSFPAQYGLPSPTGEIVRPELRRRPVNSVWELGAV